ncbi:MAG: hypothetical protein DDT19_02591 [Syntrophomonadaceae bacterium]|nr:hypothetical protein [Bacillota bacterium]
MCEPTLIAAGLTMVGSAIQNRAQEKAVRRQENIARQAEETQIRRQREQQGLVLDEAGRYDPVRRTGSMEQSARTAQQSLGTALAQASAANPQDDAGATGRVSDEYNAARAASVIDQTGRAAEEARLMSRTRAPGDMMGNEGLDYANMLSQIGTIGSQGRGEWERDMRRRAAVRPSGGQMLLGDAIRAGGMIVGARAGRPKPQQAPAPVQVGPSR